MNASFVPPAGRARALPAGSALLQSARFFTSVAHWQQLPREGLPEVAFVGRSNVGKSTLINRLCQQRRQAFASKTPGRTRLLNYFAVGQRGETLGYLVDLPGYGFASVAHEQHEHWDSLLTRYLTEHRGLRALVLLVDIRRGLGDLDRQLLNLLAPTNTALCLTLTKADKLTRSATRQAILTLEREAPVEVKTRAKILCVSSLTRDGLDELADVVQGWLQTLPAASA